MNTVGDKVKRRSAFHFDRIARVLSQYKRRCVIGRIGTPPASPAVVFSPGTARRSEHISTENPSADIGHAARGEVVIRTRCSAVSSGHLVKSACCSQPFMKFLAADAQWIVETLVRSGAVPVNGNRETVYAHF